MSGLQLLLLGNFIVIGALLTLAVQHAYAHFRPRPQPRPSVANQSAHLPAEVRQRVLEAAEANYKNILDKAGADLQRDLAATTAKLNEQLGSIGSSAVQAEMKRNQSQLDETVGQVDKKLAAEAAELEANLAKHSAEMEQRLNEEFAAEKQRLGELLDTKLADAVTSFLLETLGHEVDLGSQTPYLLATLEAHKDELVKGIVDET